MVTNTNTNTIHVGPEGIVLTRADGTVTRWALQATLNDNPALLNAQWRFVQGLAHDVRCETSGQPRTEVTWAPGWYDAHFRA